MPKRTASRAASRGAVMALVTLLKGALQFGEGRGAVPSDVLHQHIVRVTRSHACQPLINIVPMYLSALPCVSKKCAKPSGDQCCAHGYRLQSTLTCQVPLCVGGWVRGLQPSGSCVPARLRQCQGPAPTYTGAHAELLISGSH
jgi:hypothetical protein